MVTKRQAGAGSWLSSPPSKRNSVKIKVVNAFVRQGFLLTALACQLRAIKAFNKGILRRASWLNMINQHLIGLPLELQNLGEEL